MQESRGGRERPIGQTSGSTQRPPHELSAAVTALDLLAGGRRAPTEPAWQQSDRNAKTFVKEADLRARPDGVEAGRNREGAPGARHRRRSGAERTDSSSGRGPGGGSFRRAGRGPGAKPCRMTWKRWRRARSPSPSPGRQRASAMNVAGRLGVRTSLNARRTAEAEAAVMSREMYNIRGCPHAADHRLRLSQRCRFPGWALLAGGTGPDRARRRTGKTAARELALTALSLSDWHRARLALLALAAISLTAGLWAVLVRIGWALPATGAGLALAHGPLMVASVLGVVIGLERAVALGMLWAYGAPITGRSGRASARAQPASDGCRGAVQREQPAPRRDLRVSVSALTRVGDRPARGWGGSLARQQRTLAGRALHGRASPGGARSWS